VRALRKNPGAGPPPPLATGDMGQVLYLSGLFPLLKIVSFVGFFIYFFIFVGTGV
jgi:hypothetical protein